MTSPSDVSVLAISPIERLGPKFARPYIDIDEERSVPRPHRYVHGGFEGTATRFSLYFPPEEIYEGRFLQMPGANLDGLGSELIATEMPIYGGIDVPFDAGCYYVWSVAFPGYPSEPDDPAYARNSGAACALLAKEIAAQIYGAEPAYGYLFGGSGGGTRTLDCIQNFDDIWHGSVPFMTGGYVENGNSSIFSNYYSSLANVLRVLGPKVDEVIDAVDVGGSGNPFEGLTTEQRLELGWLYKLGYPRRSEALLKLGAGVALWTWVARATVQAEPEYFGRFWNTPGFAGHDTPESFADDLIDDKVTVTRVFTSDDIASGALEKTAEATAPGVVAGGLVSLSSRLARRPEDRSMTDGEVEAPVAIALDRAFTQDLGGARIQISSGAAAGRTLYLMGGLANVVIASTTGDPEAGLAFTDVSPGDEAIVDNRDHLAYGYYYRHHALTDLLTVDAKPIFEQQAPFTGGLGEQTSFADARPNGKMILVQHAQDRAVWPPDMTYYARAIEQNLGDETDDRFRFWWTDNAEHVFPPMVPSGPVPVHESRFVNFQPIIEQAVHDLIAWVEHGQAPPDNTNYELTKDRALVLSRTAGERRGIQPVVTATANGAARADVKVKEPVTLELTADVPPDAGTIVGAEWDFDGTGTYSFRHDEIDGASTSVRLSVTHVYDAPGTYFVSARVFSRRDGDVAATRRRLPNLGRARVVVT
jgi:hypothetical protein